MNDDVNDRIKCINRCLINANKLLLNEIKYLHTSNVTLFVITVIEFIAIIYLVLK